MIDRSKTKSNRLDFQRWNRSRAGVFLEEMKRKISRGKNQSITTVNRKSVLLLIWQSSASGLNSDGFIRRVFVQKKSFRSATTDPNKYWFVPALWRRRRANFALSLDKEISALVILSSTNRPVRSTDDFHRLDYSFSFGFLFDVVSLWFDCSSPIHCFLIAGDGTRRSIWPLSCFQNAPICFSMSRRESSHWNSSANLRKRIFVKIEKQVDFTRLFSLNGEDDRLRWRKEKNCHSFLPRPIDKRPDLTLTLPLTQGQCQAELMQDDEILFARWKINKRRTFLGFFPTDLFCLLCLLIFDFNRDTSLFFGCATGREI